MIDEQDEAVKISLGLVLGSARTLEKVEVNFTVAAEPSLLEPASGCLAVLYRIRSRVDLFLLYFVEFVKFPIARRFFRVGRSGQDGGCDAERRHPVQAHHGPSFV